MTRSIAPIAAADVRRIAGAQVVPDMRAAVKELVENALDAQATSIELRFKEYGLDSIEVVDNGAGITKENYAALCQRHHTSKLATFEDLVRVETFGFRGEALASLCTVARVTIITATQTEAPMGTVLEFDHQGVLIAQDKRQARSRGTTVILRDLLSNLPVRRRELEKHVKREYNKAHTMLQAYALITQNVRWSSCVQLENGRQVSQLVMRSASGPNAIQTNMSALFGTKASAAVQPLDLDISLDEPARLQGVISKPTMGLGRSSGDRQYFYLNGRPWDCTKLAHICNQVYRTFNATQYPTVIANLIIGPDKYDVNVSPDKRTLYVHDETALLERIRELLEDTFSPSRGVFAVDEPKKRDAPPSSPEPAKMPRTQDTISTQGAPLASSPSSEPIQSSFQDQFRRAVVNFARHTNTSLEYEEASDEEMDAVQQLEDFEPEHVSEDAVLAPDVCPDHDLQHDEVQSGVAFQDDDEEHDRHSIDCHDREERHEYDEQAQERISQERILHEQACEHTHESEDTDNDRVPMEEPVPPQPDTQTYTRSLRQSESEEHSSAPLESISFDWSTLSHRKAQAGVAPEPTAMTGADVGQPDAQAAAVMERVIPKSDFRTMSVVGQFNLGFIIARRETASMDDLFIIDQHAADEKHNFEDLQKNLRIYCQRLVVPQRVELAPSDELVAREHQDWLRINGFDMALDESSPPGSRVRLLSKPVSKGTVFDVHDFEELLHLLRDAPAGRINRVRCSKVYDMLASRACRKSIMIGTALQMRKMQSVVHNMADTDQPWNCPHGRPTMRHLTTLRSPRMPRPIAWSTIGLL